MWQVSGSCGDGRNASLGRRVISLYCRRWVKVAPLHVHAQMRRSSRAHWCPARWRAYYIPVVGGAGKRRPENYDFRVVRRHHCTGGCATQMFFSNFNFT